ncbi:NADH-quinone oxidoreductase subunit B family protein [Thermovibrio ammonificans]|jgi:NADH-quinone oxidoreductase B subunit|uniref:NADH ubiquinone oxidoreductase 20 kDa subunit n=1 Tax=Thermovibrio ammonificans (strain DSM 15698 / JCM 12110 / HB-1) TaxID=648996 RepID=E8T5B4_THEA1|nr:NADH-quinone oxidoreductase subunit B family protein [Thermovibrio ammonificans]ADU96452.1 NADH ubiquinone oxidoreductase 20 kDa subunit [Thermovibrio ammonificans HB-1]
MGLETFRKKSPWLLHYNTGSCNGCDIEILACLAPKYDLERFGILNRGNPKQSDVLIVTGPVTKRAKERLLRLYYEMPEPKVVVAVGACACTGGVFRHMYNVENGVDSVIPVDVYVPGCAARPESIIDGVIKALEILERKKKSFEKGKLCKPIEAKEPVNRKKFLEKCLEALHAGRRD